MTRTSEAVRQTHRPKVMLLAVVLALGPGPAQSMGQVSPASAARPAKPIDAASIPPQIRAPTAIERAELERLKSEVTAATAARKWHEVERLSRQTLIIQEQTYGPRHPNVAVDTHRIGQSYDHRGRYAEAEPFYRKALNVYSTALGEAHPETARSQNNLAANLQDQGRYNEAEPLYRKTLQVMRAALGENHPDTAKVYSNLATNLLHQGRYSDAEPLFRRVLEIRRAALGEAHPETAQSYGNLATNLEAQGRYVEAEPLFRAALKISRAAVGEAHRDTATGYNNLAANLHAQGLYREAEPLFRGSLETLRTAQGEPHPETAQGYNNLAANLDSQGRYVEAEPLFRRSLEIRRAALGEAHPTTAKGYNNLAANLNSQGRYDEAEPLFRKALEIYRAALGEPHPDVARSLSNVASNLQDQSRHSEAEPLYRRALQIYRTALGEAHPDTARGYNDLAGIMKAQDFHVEAERLYRRALEIRSAALGHGHPDTATGYNNLAAILNSQGRYDEAEPLYRKALDIYRPALGETHSETAIGYSNLAGNFNDQGRYVEAEPLIARAVAIARGVRDVAAGVSASGAEGSFQRARAGAGDEPEPLRRLYGFYVQAAYGAGSVDLAGRDALRAKAFTAAQDYTSSSAARAMAQAQARTATGGGALGELVNRQQALTARVRALDAQLLGALGRGDAESAARLKAGRERALAALTAADDRLTEDFPAYARLVSPRAVEVGVLQQRLAADEGLILIVPVEQDVFSFAVSRGRVAWSKLEKGRTDVEAMARILRGRMESGWQPFDRQAAYGLYRDLVKPVEPALANVDRLYVVASGALSDLPLGLLMTAPPVAGSGNTNEALAEASTWLADRYAMSTLPAVSNLGEARPNRAVDRPGGQRRGVSGFVGYGAPVLLGSGGGPGRAPDGRPAKGQVLTAFEAGHPLADPRWIRANFEPLSGPAEELQRMARDLGAPESSVRLGPAATEQAVKRDPLLYGAEIVAFATHGFLPGQVPGVTEPGLVFTPPADDKPSLLDDGVLTASEAAELRFTADWIILSACNTATSDGASGADGLSSLARGFLYAGAGALLASHWSVDDAATSALTTETLALRKSGLTRAEALQGAMRAIRTGYRRDGSALPGWKSLWADPAFWGPFTIITNQDR